MGRNSATPGIVILVCGILGLLVAAIEQIAYESGYLLNEYITDAAQLPGLQIISIVVFLLIGCVLAAFTAS